MQLNLKFLIFLLALFVLFNVFKKDNSSSVSSLKAYFTAVGDSPSLLGITLNYTNPASFGESGEKYGATMFYLIECDSNGNCPADALHPSPSDIINQKNITPGSFLLQTQNSVPSANVTSFIAPPQLQNLISGRTYKLGVSVINDQQSIYGIPELPHVYGDFVYTTLVYADPTGPGAINNLSGKFVL